MNGDDQVARRMPGVLAPIGSGRGSWRQRFIREATEAADRDGVSVQVLFSEDFPDAGTFQRAIEVGRTRVSRVVVVSDMHQPDQRRGRSEDGGAALLAGVPDHALHALRDVLEDWSGVALTLQQLVRLIEDDLALYQDLSDSGCCDTVAREAALSALSSRVLGRDWPPTLDAVDMDLFIGALQAAARRAGFALAESVG